MFDKKPETVALLDRMYKGKQGDIITPEQMKSILKVSSMGSTSEGYRTFYRVARAVERRTDGKLCWRWIRGDNVYRCLTNDQMPLDVTNRTWSIRRRARRNVMISNAVDMSSLSEAEQRSLQVQCVINGAIATLASRSMVAKLTRQMPQAVVPSAEDLMSAVRAREAAWSSVN